jgi:hypothetical protein
MLVGLRKWTLMVFACTTALVAVSQSVVDERPTQRCSDELALALKQKFPQGVPGRTMPSELKTDGVDSAFTYVIPVVVHVMYHSTGAERNVTPEQIQSQIDILNEGFGRYGEGANTSELGGEVKIKFCLAKVDPYGEPTLGYDYTQTSYATSLDPFTEDTLMKKINQWDPNRYLNIWTVRSIPFGANALAGYTYIPEQVAGTAYDGIVIDYRYFGRDAGTALTRGKTGTHEAGHYFDLYHPWGETSTAFCPAGTDYCEDTPPVPGEEFATYPECASPQSILFWEACDATRRQVENYMDYSDDGCINLFTHCQIQRMRSALLRYRSEMVSRENLFRTGCGQEMLDIPSQGQIFVYPNPANTFMMVNVDIDTVGQVRLEMFDFMGRKVMVNENASTGRGPIPLDVSQFAAGTYYLTVITSNESISTKIFVGRFE